MKTKYTHAVLFYALSTAIPWGCWCLAGYASHAAFFAKHGAMIKSALGVAGLLAPMTVALALIHKEGGLRREFFGRFFNFDSTKGIYEIVTVFLMPASILLAQAISLLFGHSAAQFQFSAHYTFSSGVMPVWFLLILAPVLEELGWHTYGTDCLRNRFSLFTTSMLFATYWSFWHVPLALIKDSYQSNVVTEGWIYSANFMVSVFPFVVIMNWLYYKTKRNILVPVVFHLLAGFSGEVFNTHPDSKIIQTGILTIVAAWIIISDPKFFFTKEWHDNSPRHPAKRFVQ